VQLGQPAEPGTVQPAPNFPARIALVRVQAPKYRSMSAEGLGKGEFSVVSPQELPNAAQTEALEHWPAVDKVMVLNEHLLPERLKSLDDLRLVAAKMQADVLMIYTLDTGFEVDGHAFGAAAKVPLGKQPAAEDGIVSSATSVLIDVRTGYRFGTLTGNAKLDHLTAEDWSTEPRLDQRRLEAEAQALSALIEAAAPTWKGIAGPYR
jgi:hypothetical protein